MVFAVDGLRPIERVTVKRLVAEASSWGMPRSRASQVVDEVLDRLPEAIEVARTQTPDIPVRFLATIREQTERLRGG